MDLERLSRPCASSRCDHTRSCWEGDQRRAEAGHPPTIVSRPKMDAPELVAAVCGCGDYSSNPSSQNGAMESWRQHADAKIAAAAERVRAAPGGDTAGASPLLGGFPL